MSERRPDPQPFDDSDVDVRTIARLGIWLGVVTVLGFVVAWAIYLGLSYGEQRRDPTPSPIAEASQVTTPPGPRLQPAPERELAAVRSHERARLEAWGWSDRPAGVARVPVERAIAEIADRGSLPDFTLPIEPIGATGPAGTSESDDGDPAP
jgi:hypothetical protein